MASSGAGVDLPTAWGLLGVRLRTRLRDHPPRQRDIERRLCIPHGVLTSFYDGLVAEGYLSRDGELLLLTDRGRTAVVTLGDAWTSWLSEQLVESDSERAVMDARVRAAIGRIARRLMAEDQPDLTPA
ncbi:hypothetical protein [Parafrankia elaeagni]|uniref:hypothetical protein n=1 Tax=Parafrankia elaeagni TaxID=222534 RepID=UPI001E38EF07|nr:hypothetical protein [Parafrankia elaeagni]